MTSFDPNPVLSDAEFFAVASDETKVATSASPLGKACDKQRRWDGWFQPELVVRGAKAEALLAYLEQLITSAEGRVRRRRDRDLICFRRTLNSVIANALWGRHALITPAIAYFRGNDAYSGSHWPSWLTPDNLKRVVDGATAVGLVQASLGRRNHWRKIGNSSTFEMSAKLHDKLCSFDVSPNCLAIAPEDVPLIVLKDTNKKPLDVVPAEHPEAKAMFERVASYNRFLADHKLTMECDSATAAEIERDMFERASKAPSYGKQFTYRRIPELFRTTLYRVFNNGRWDHGGRFVGGWWQTIPSKWRRYVCINASPTVELDYAGFSLRAIYHRCGIDYRDDPYQLSQVDALKLTQDYRPEIKKLVQALLNCEPGKSLLHVNIGRRLPRPARRTLLIEWLREKHHRIAHTFQTREGIRIQRLESDIVDGILAAGAEAGIVVLPIHDSYLVPVDQRDWLRGQMTEHYRKVFGFDPVIEEKT